MFDYIHGTVAAVGERHVVVDVQGLGYVVVLSKTEREVLGGALEQKVHVYVHMHVQQDGNVLYGFLDKQVRALFWDLLEVSGVGPKLAQNVLDELSPGGLVQVVHARDAQRLQGVAGVGKKMADRIVTELQNSKSFQKHNVSSDFSGCMVHLKDVQPYLIGAGFKEGAIREAFRDLGGSGREMDAEALTKALIEKLCKNPLHS